MGGGGVDVSMMAGAERGFHVRARARVTRRDREEMRRLFGPCKVTVGDDGWDGSGTIHACIWVARRNWVFDTDGS